MKRTFPIIAVLMASLTVLAVAAEDTIISNVFLIDRDDNTEAIPVHIHIEGQRLKLVSKAPIKARAGTREIDGKGGFVMGRLDVGGPANLMILDGDPRTDFDVILDTKAHATFAMHKGAIVKSSLPVVTKTAHEAETEAAPPEQDSGWFAYTPPPIALPVHYGSARPWNYFDTESVSGAFILGVIVDRTRWWADDDTESILGEALDESGSGEVRGLRFGMVGALKFEEPWIYTLFAASNAFASGFDAKRDDGISMFDYRLDIPTPGGTTLSVGKQKEPISMERVGSGMALPMQERSAAADAMLPSRNFGIVLSGNPCSKRASWAVGAFNDWLIDGDDFSDSATQFVGRVTWVPWMSADESNLVHVGAGLRYSDAKEGVQYRTEPEINDGPVFLDTGFLEADSALTWNLEAAWRKGPFWLTGEYFRSDVDTRDFGTPGFWGYNVTGSWALTGEMRDYKWKSGTFGGLSVARSVEVGGPGAIEATLRYSHLDLNDNGIDGGATDIFSAGLNWWLRSDLMASVNYRMIDLERSGESGTSHALVGRLVFLIE